jgi:hypothetical protein
LIAHRPTGGFLDLMNEVTRILSAIEAGDPHAAAELVAVRLRQTAHPETGSFTLKGSHFVSTAGLPRLIA